MKKYTHPRIKGKIPEKILPKGVSLVLEGGGARGCYTAGVLDCFAEKNVMFPYVVGVSAGAGNGLSYVSGQKGRNKEMIAHHIPKKEYMGVHHWLRTKSFLNRDYIFREMEEKHCFFDWNQFLSSPTHFLTGALNCNTGRTHWYTKQDLKRSILPTMASTAVPFLSTMVELDGDLFLDGGLQDAIPIQKSLEDGNQFHVVVLTQDRTYRKKYNSFPFASLIYGKYPELVEILKERHKAYNRQLALCYQLEKEGKAMIIQPEKPVKIGRFEQKCENLLDLYGKGLEETSRNMKKNKVLEELLEKEGKTWEYLSAQTSPPSQFL